MVDRDWIRDCAVLGCLWFAAVALVNPIGEFPLNDDWAFARTVKGMYEDGIYAQPGWASMTFVSQALWGLLFCLPAGFSFTALRFSTIVLGLTGVWATYFLLRETAGSRRLAVIGSIVVAGNPIYFALSQTFMTDVPFTALNTVAAYFCVRAIKSESVRPVLWGSLFALLAVLCRQIGIAIPLVFCLAYFIQKKYSLPSLGYALLPLAIASLAMFAFEHWLTLTQSLPEQYNAPVDWIRERFGEENRSVLPSQTYVNSAAIWLYGGLFLGPFLVLILFGYLRSFPLNKFRMPGLLFACVALALQSAILIGGKPMPLLSNIFSNEGIGPITLHDTYILGESSAPGLPLWFWIGVTAASIALGAILVVLLVAGIGKFRRSWTKDQSRKTIFLFLSLSSILYLIPIVVLGVWDRYLLPALPLLMGTVSLVPKSEEVGEPRFLTGAAVFLAILTFLFSIAITHDYMRWNRTRWNALTQLRVKEGIEPSQIDGGLEYNGWYLYNPDYIPTVKKSWWWIDGDQYMMTMKNVAGYEVIRTYPYSRWIPPNQFRLLLLRKVSQSARNANNSGGLNSLSGIQPVGENLSFFMLGRALQIDHPTKDFFDVSFETAVGHGSTMSQLAYVEQKQGELLNTRVYQKHFRDGLIQVARMLLEAQQAYENEGDAWASAFDMDRFRTNFTGAISSFQHSRDLGAGILKQFKKAERRIDRNKDQRFSNEEITSFLTPKLKRKKNR